MHTYTWRDAHQPVAVRLIHNGSNTGMVKIVTEVDEVVVQDIELPAEAMEVFARTLVGSKLTELLEDNGFC